MPLKLPKGFDIANMLNLSDGFIKTAFDNNWHWYFLIGLGAVFLLIMMSRGSYVIP